MPVYGAAEDLFRHRIETCGSQSLIRVAMKSEGQSRS